MDSVVEKLKENLQIIYRKAIDADEKLNVLHQQGKGQFKTIFEANSGFKVSSKRFKPYVDELMEEVAALESAKAEDLQQTLPIIVKKIEVCFKTLASFQESLRDK